MNYKSTVEYLYGLKNKGEKPTLLRTKSAIETLGVQNRFSVIHIAGTNGKGSVAQYTACALKSAGYKTGLFISPHILDIRERITVNGEKISESDFVKIANRIIKANLNLNMFEFLTVMAFDYFNRVGVDVAVLETGLGGRFDATNTAGNKLITAITKIGLDHEKMLGDTVEKIAAEKCGIINTEKTVSSPLQTKAALKVIKKAANNLIIPDLSAIEEVSLTPTRNTFVYKGEKYETAMSGEHQIENAVTAIEILNNCGLNLKQTDIKQGLKSAFMPARMQTVSGDPLIIIDGAHNPDGAVCLAKTLRSLPPFTAVVGFMKDKNYDKVLSLTLPFADSVICTAADDSPRSLPPVILAECANKYSKNVTYKTSVKEAIEAAKAIGKPVVIFGSLYLAANALKTLKHDN